MKKVIELFKGLKVAKGDVGIEIECEGKNLKEIFTDVWKTTHDGSLRGRYPDQTAEYVLDHPIPVGAVEAAIINLKESLEGATFEFSYRTSVHVHVNVQQLKYEQLLAMLYTYYLLEEPLMTFSGKKRKGNNFCLRLQDAEGMLQTVNKMFEHGEFGIKFIPQDVIRYSAMNLEALKKYGSVEFRGMEGNIDVNRIKTLCMALVRIREYGDRCDTPEAVYERFNELGPIAFMNDVLGDVADEFYYPRALKDILTSFSISLDLPFAFKRFASRPAKKDGEWHVGDIVDYDTALKVQRAGGQVVHSDVPHMYEVTVAPVVRKVAKAVKFDQVIADDWLDAAIPVPVWNAAQVRGV